ncbi:MAG: M24 family metallopeptidase [Gemmatimonadales bacterium]
MPDARERRQGKLRRALADRGMGGMLVASLPSIRYLTGFSGSGGMLIVAERATILVTDFRYASQAPAEVGSSAEVQIEPKHVWGGVRDALARLGVRRIGIERDQLTLAGVAELEPLEGVEAVPVSGMVEALREVKDEAEITALRDAARLACDALDSILGFIRPGRTEFEVAAELEAALRRRGSEWFAFPTIVASGPRTALPHARCSGRAIQEGDWLLLDFGAQVDGYCSDITRTYVVGAQPDGRQREVYEVVRRAQEAARREIRPGQTGKEADDLARDLIIQAGMGDRFGHSLGHGLGLEVHEGPRLSQRNADPLPVGAVVTVEPGVYFDGWGGVRIEDDVVLRPDGAECLSDGRTELTALA